MKGELKPRPLLSLAGILELKRVWVETGRRLYGRGEVAAVK